MCALSWASSLEKIACAQLFLEEYLIADEKSLLLLSATTFKKGSEKLMVLPVSVLQPPTINGNL